MARSRKPTDDEIRLWRGAMRDTEPLEDVPASPIDTRDPAPKLKPPPKPIKRVKPVSPEAAVPKKKPVQKQSINALDKKSAQRVRRGQIRPDARLDLHGMRRSEAHPALIHFITESVHLGRRVVLVITGKGTPPDQRSHWSDHQSGHQTGHWSDDEPRSFQPGRGGGVLKAKVPLWLETPPLRDMIHSLQESHQRHGGSGALYVFLRKRN